MPQSASFIRTTSGPSALSVCNHPKVRVPRSMLATTTRSRPLSFADGPGGARAFDPSTWSSKVTKLQSYKVTKLQILRAVRALAK